MVLANMSQKRFLVDVGPTAVCAAMEAAALIPVGDILANLTMLLMIIKPRLARKSGTTLTFKVAHCDGSLRHQTQAAAAKKLVDERGIAKIATVQHVATTTKSARKSKTALRPQTGCVTATRIGSRHNEKKTFRSNSRIEFDFEPSLVLVAERGASSCAALAQAPR